MIVRFPAGGGNGTSQDREWCEVELDGRSRRVRFHDYDQIFAVPGLYELIFHEHLECRSPEEVVGLLAEELEKAGVDPESLSGIDVGAGNGLVGEELKDAGVGTLVGADIIEEAALGAERDRPDVYDDYVVCDLTELGGEQRRRLCAHGPNLLTTVAALGFDDIPPLAFAEAFNLVADDGWIAFNIKADFLDDKDGSGFRRLIARMWDEGILEECSRRRYRHRLSMDGRALDYVAVVGRKRSGVPLSWVENVR